MSWRRSDTRRHGWRNARGRLRARDRLGVYIDRGELVFGPARSHPAEFIGNLAWRYRNELAPYYMAVGLAAFASVAHLYAPALWPAALPVGPGLTAASWRRYASRRPQRAYVLAVGGAATMWTAAVWWTSPADGWLVLTGFIGATAAAIPRWWHYRRRSRITVQQGSPRGARRELRRIVKGWPELAEYMELAGSHIQRAEADAIGFTLTLALRAGLTAADFVSKLSRVESVLKARPGAARLVPDVNRADRVFVRIVRRDPLATPMPWPGTAAASVNEPIVLGRFEPGDAVAVTLVGEHMLIGGAMGRGKSGLLNVVMAELSVRLDVVLWGIDMKRGLELAPWLPVLDRLATSEDSACELLAAANRVLDARAELLAERGERKWLPTAAEPALVIAIDELAELNAEALALFERTARMGRAVAIILVAVTQRPSAAALGGLDARTQLTARVSLGVIEARDAELILGSGRLSAGWRAERLGGPGYFLVLVPGQHEVPRPARAYWLTDEAVRGVARRSDMKRPGLDAVSADAAEKPRTGGETPADVLSDGDPIQRRVDPDEALLAALRAAPRAGLSARELAARIGRSRSWTFGRLRFHARTGRAVQLGHGRWHGGQQR